MRVRLHRMLVGAVLAPALLASGATQGMLLMRCGPTVSMSCCCPGEQQPDPAATVEAAKAGCCDTIAVPAGPAQAAHDEPAPSLRPPASLAITGQAAVVVLHFGRERSAPRLDPPLRPSPILANCALLI